MTIVTYNNSNKHPGANDCWSIKGKETPVESLFPFDIDEKVTEKALLSSLSEKLIFLSVREMKAD